MKKLFLFTTLVMCLWIPSGKAQNFKTYPIPSYNILSYGIANFLEESKKSCKDAPLEMRHIHIKCIASNTCPVTVWIYSKDGLDILGPYTVNPGEILTVEIDDREWGVYTTADCEVLISVWIDDISSPPCSGN